MTATTEEIVRICETLPPEKRDEVADFARFLLSRRDEDIWEAKIADERPRPRLEAFLKESAAEGDEPLDPLKL